MKRDSLNEKNIEEILKDWVGESQISDEERRGRVIFSERIQASKEDSAILHKLDFTRLKLTTLPKIFHDPLFSEVKEVDLSFNDLKTFPVELLKINCLEDLAVSHNQIEEIPEAILENKNLQWLDLTANKIQRLPIEEVGKIQDWLILLIGENPISLEEQRRVENLEDRLVVFCNPDNFYNSEFEQKKVNEVRLSKETEEVHPKLSQDVPVDQNLFKRITKTFYKNLFSEANNSSKQSGLNPDDKSRIEHGDVVVGKLRPKNKKVSNYEYEEHSEKKPSDSEDLSKEIVSDRAKSENKSDVKINSSESKPDNKDSIGEKKSSRFPSVSFSNKKQVVIPLKEGNNKNTLPKIS